MKRIAIVRTCALGDAVQCTPVLQQIRADQPAAELTFFTSANAASLFNGASFVDRVVPLEAAWVLDSNRRGLWRAWWEIARHGPFDALVSLEPTWLRNLGSVLVRAPMKAGLSFIEGRKPFELFTHPLRITGDSRRTTMHASQQYLELWLRMTGNQDRGFGYNMRHLLDDRIAVNSEQLICLAPGTGNAFRQQPTKQWHPQSFRELGEALIERGYAVAYVGGKDDLAPVSVPKGAQDFLGKTSVREVATMLRGAIALIGNDSGLFHLAQGVGCPAIGIFGPTSALFTGAFRSSNAITLQATLPCVPCYRAMCDSDEPVPKPCCMSAVRVEQILEALEQLMPPKLVAATLSA
jgi:ADP-heptose:LPS heptosyltransferase